MHNFQSGCQSLIADKPLTPDAAKAAPHHTEPSRPSGGQCSPSLAPTPNPMIETTPGPSIVGMAPRPNSSESPNATSLSPQSQGPSTSGEAPIGGDSSQMSKEIPCKRGPVSHRYPHQGS
jgi:hypothetical protein